MRHLFFKVPAQSMKLKIFDWCRLCLDCFSLNAQWRYCVHAVCSFSFSFSSSSCVHPFVFRLSKKWTRETVYKWFSCVWKRVNKMFQATGASPWVCQMSRVTKICPECLSSLFVSLWRNRRHERAPALRLFVLPSTLPSWLFMFFENVEPCVTLGSEVKVAHLKTLKPGVALRWLQFWSGDSFDRCSRLSHSGSVNKWARCRCRILWR